MSDLISRQAAIDAIQRDPMGGLNYERILSDLPTDDAVEVVRCRDCKHWQWGTIDEQDNFIPPKCAIQTNTHDARHADDFCSWAERKERKQ